MLNRIIVSALILPLVACSKPIDQRQEVFDSSLRRMFFGDIYAVYDVSTPEFGNGAYGEAARDIASELAELATEPIDFARRNIAGILSSTLLNDVDDYQQRRRCLYIVGSNDPMLLSLADEEVFGFDLSEDEEEPEYKMRNFISAAQVCDNKLKPGTRVFITLNSDGATFHPLSNDIKRIENYAHREETVSYEETASIAPKKAAPVVETVKTAKPQPKPVVAQKHKPETVSVSSVEGPVTQAPVKPTIKSKEKAGFSPSIPQPLNSSLRNGL